MRDDSDPRLFIPASVSLEAAAILRRVGTALAATPPQQPPTNQEDFDEAAARAASFADRLAAGPLARLAPSLSSWRAGEVPILSVTPSNATRDAVPLIYVHGGGFVSGSAQANLLTAAYVAQTSGRTVHSIDYTLAPRAAWRQILDEVCAAWQVIADLTQAPPGLIGDSAGACIALAATLKLRDKGDRLPGALVLLSPLVDLARGGDTNVTLANYDFLDRRMLAPGLLAYAGPEEWSNPLVSPICGDFAPGFPPVLIQAGTREALLSDAVRLHRRLRAAGQPSRLELYEGMPHVFQAMLADTPEGLTAWAEISAFWFAELERHQG